ncbi:MAG: glycoside hydrolase family 15 protein [Polyangiales bacterium]
MRFKPFAALVSGFAFVTTSVAAAVPHRSIGTATSGNGFGFVVYDLGLHKVTWLTEAPYKAHDATTQTRNVAYDAYFGLRADAESGWLSNRAIDDAGYLSEGNVIAASQSLGPLRAKTHVFAPWGLSSAAMVIALEVTNTSSLTLNDAAAFALVNLHLGNGSPLPDNTGESLSYDAASDSFAVTGPSGLTARSISLSPTVHHGAYATGLANPYDLVNEGGDLPDVASTPAGVDAVPAFEWSLAGIAPGETRWVGALVTLGDLASAKTFIASRAPDKIVSDEVSAWESWRAAPPTGLNAHELSVFRQSESVLRMAQSRLAAPSGGQILAALPPGQWWISWVRDMTYATNALARMGHTAEAQAAIAFMKGAKVGGYQSYVGAPYTISVVRYFGDGDEESDTNSNGPNIEFDGFGLAMWAAHAAGSSDLDASATTIEALSDPTGVIKADSSIWETHWNGQQQRFAYSSIADARGLCDAGQTAQAKALRDAIVSNDVLSSGGLAQSVEAIARGTQQHDAAVVEAINFGLINPKGAIAKATMTDFESLLRVESGFGFFRNQDGGGYDQQEWLYIDLRIASALHRMGRDAEAATLLSWVTEQAHDNLNLVPELLDPQTGDFVGSIPMVGFGAGAYVLALLDRATTPATDPCFPSEGPDVPMSLKSSPSLSNASDASSLGGCGVSPHSLRTTSCWTLCFGALGLLAARRRGGSR